MNQMKVGYVVMTCRLDLEVTLSSLRDVLCAGNPQTVAKSFSMFQLLLLPWPHGLHQGISRGDVGHLGPGSRDSRAGRYAELCWRISFVPEKY